MWRGRQSWLQIVGSRPASEWLARVAVLAPNSWLATCLQIVGAGGGVGSKELAAQGNIHKYGARRPANMNNRPAGCGKTGKCEQVAHHITAITRNGHRFPSPCKRKLLRIYWFEAEASLVSRSSRKSQARADTRGLSTGAGGSLVRGAVFPALRGAACPVQRPRRPPRPALRCRSRSRRVPRAHQLGAANGRDRPRFNSATISDRAPMPFARDN